MVGPANTLSAGPVLTSSRCPFAEKRLMELRFILGREQANAGLPDRVAQGTGYRPGALEDLENFLARVVTGNPVDIDGAAAGADVDEHDVASSLPAIFVEAIVLIGQAHRLHSRMAGRGAVSGPCIDMQRMKTDGAMVAVRRAHGRAWKHHLSAIGAAECAICGGPAIVEVLSGFAVAAFVGADPFPPEIVFVVEHVFLPFISNQMNGQNKISGDVWEILLPARSTRADSDAVCYERLINAQDDRSARVG